MIKRSLLALALILGIALPAHGAIARVGSPVNGDIAGQPIDTIILPGTTIGNMIVLVIGYSGATLTSVNISGEIDPTRIAGFNMAANGDTYAIFYLANNTTGGSKTIDINFSANAYATAIAVEYSGQDTTTQPDATTTPVTGATGDPTISITTATAGDLIITACSSDAGKPTQPSGYSDLNLSNPGFYGNASDNVAAGIAGSKTLIWADVTNSSWGVTAVAFKAAAVAGGVPVRHRVVQ